MTSSNDNWYYTLNSEQNQIKKNKAPCAGFFVELQMFDPRRKCCGVVQVC